MAGGPGGRGCPALSRSSIHVPSPKIPPNPAFCHQLPWGTKISSNLAFCRGLVLWGQGARRGWEVGVLRAQRPTGPAADSAECRTGGRVRHDNGALFLAALAVYCLGLFPAVLERTSAVGFDAPIYWRAGRGDFAENGTPGWVYCDRLLGLLRVWARLPYPAALFVLHAANSYGLVAVCAAALRRRDRYPNLAWAIALGVGVKASDILGGGNVSGLLAGLSLSPWGALAAAAVKPWMLGVVAVHAVVLAASEGRRVVQHGTPGVGGSG